MNARARLIAYLQQTGLSTARAEANVDAFAHELAQQQRNWDAEVEGYTDPQMAVYAVADLIDPKANDDWPTA